MLAICLFSLLVPTLTKASDFVCPTPVVCDPTEGYLASYDVFDAATCEQLCQYSGDNSGGLVMGCKFFTYWQRQGTNKDCHFLNECTPLLHAPGAHSGMWDCADDAMYCTGAGEVPAYDDKETLWTCDSGYAYGDQKIFPGVTCTASCPSFIPEDSLPVSTICQYSAAAAKSTWSPATPEGVTSADGTPIANPEETSTLPCGCADLVLDGEVVMQDDNGLELRCTEPPPQIAGGQTTFSQNTECVLFCDGVLTWDLYCSQGVWSVPELKQASDVKCYGTGEYVTLSTWFPPQTTTTTAENTTTMA